MKKFLTLVLINAMMIILLCASASATWYPKPVGWTISRDEAQEIKKMFDEAGYEVRFLATEQGTKVFFWDEVMRCSISWIVTLPGDARYHKGGNYSCELKEGEEFYNVTKKLQMEVEKILKKDN